MRWFVNERRKPKDGFSLANLNGMSQAKWEMTEIKNDERSVGMLHRPNLLDPSSLDEMALI